MPFSAPFILIGILSSCSVIYFLTCIFAAWRFFTNERVVRDSSFTPPVTILVPLCGADFKALENYSSLCRQDYPLFQIVFGVLDPADTSIPVVHQLMSLFPDLDVDLSIGSGKPPGQNPKVNNLHQMLSQAKHETIAIVDSDIRVGPDFLKSVVTDLRDDKVGLVTCPYRADEAPNLPSTLEAIGITGEFIPGVIVARLLEGVTFALGAAMATSRERLQRIGGFEAIADFLADDYMLGNLIHKAGFQVRLSPYVVRTMPVHSSFMSMVRHQTRWARGTRICRPLSYMGYLVTHGTALALLCLIVSKASPAGMILFALTLLARMTMAWYVGVHQMKDAILAGSIWLLPVRDLLSFAVWCLSFFGNKVEWRSKKYRVMKGGKMMPLR